MNTTTRPTTGNTTYHRNGTVTTWNLYANSWVRGSDPGDRLLATMGAAERTRVIRHTSKAATMR